MLGAVPAVTDATRSPSSALRTAGCFAQPLLVVHAFSFLGGVVFLFPVIHDHGEWSSPAGLLDAWSTNRTGWFSVSWILWLLVLAWRADRSPRWAVAGGVTFLFLSAFWGVLAAGLLSAGSSGVAEMAFAVVLGSIPTLAGAGSCFSRAGALRLRATDTADGGMPALPSVRAVARGLDVLIVGLAFVLQTAFTDAVGGIGGSGSPSERWVTSVRWFGVFAAEAVCITLFGRTPGKALTGLRVVAARGGRLGIVRSCLRSGLVLFGMFFAWIPYVVTTYRSDRAGVHDLIAGSRVDDVRRAAA